jgi:hypothetical protein
MVSVPVRAGPVFGSTLNRTEPFPLPLAPDVMLIHGALLVAVHVQPPVVDTCTFVSLSPLAGTDRAVGSIE